MLIILFRELLTCSLSAPCVNSFSVWGAPCAGPRAAPLWPRANLTTVVRPVTHIYQVTICVCRAAGVARGKRFTCISVSAEVARALQALKRELGAGTWDQLLETLTKAFEEWREIQARKRVAKILCNDFKESRASLAAWARLLAKKLETKEEVAIALEMLKPSREDPATLEVDTNTCSEKNTQ